MSQYVDCIHPRIVVNPALPQLLLRFRHYSLNGQHKRFNGRCLPEDVNLSEFYAIKQGVSSSSVDDYYVYDRFGNTYPIFLAVPCNHCSVCVQRKTNAIVYRAHLESLCYDVPPLFVTLTYDDAHRPVDGVNKRDVQLFLKRFRKALGSRKIRFLCCAEYGTKTQRPHYHLVIFNIPLSVHTSVGYSLSLAHAHKLLSDTWKNGFVQARFIDMRSDKGIQYVCKYMYKDADNTPDGCNPPFHTSSNRHGGIGAPFIDKFKDSIRSTMDTSFKFLNKWTGKVEELRFTQYILDRLFPTFCRSVSSVFRNAALTVAQGIDRFSSHLFIDTHLYERLECCSDYFYVGRYDFSYKSDKSLSEKDYLDSVTLFSNLYHKFDLSAAQSLADKRALFVQRLFLGKTSPDIFTRASFARISVNSNRRFEVL